MPLVWCSSLPGNQNWKADIRISGFQFCFCRDERGSILQMADFDKKEKFYNYFQYLISFHFLIEFLEVVSLSQNFLFLNSISRINSMTLLVNHKQCHRIYYLNFTAGLIQCGLTLFVGTWSWLTRLTTRMTCLGTWVRSPTFGTAQHALTSVPSVSLISSIFQW